MLALGGGSFADAPIYSILLYQSYSWSFTPPPFLYPPPPPYFTPFFRKKRVRPK